MRPFSKSADGDRCRIQPASRTAFTPWNPGRIPICGPKRKIRSGISLMSADLGLAIEVACFELAGHLPRTGPQ